MNSAKERTLLKTFRISEHLDSALQKDARAKRMSLNAMVTTILTKYVEWDKFTEKFGFISVTKETFRSIMDLADEEKLVRVAKELGSRLPKEVMLFWFKKLNVEAFISYVGMFCKYGHVAEYELEIDGKNYMITAHHDLGEKWSIFLRHFVDQGMRTALGITGEFEVSRNQVIGRFRAP